MPLPFDITFNSGVKSLYDFHYTGTGGHYTGPSAGWQEAAPLDDGGWAIVVIHVDQAYPAADVTTFDVYKISPNGTIIGTLNHNPGVSSWINQSWGVCPAGNNRVRVFGKHGNTYPDYTIESWLYDLSGTTPAYVSYKAEQAATKGVYSLGHSMYYPASNACIIPHWHNYYTGTAYEYGIDVVAIDATTGNMISQVQWDQSPYNGWNQNTYFGVYNVGGVLTVRTHGPVGTHDIREHAITLSGGVLSRATTTVQAEPPTEEDFWDHAGPGTIFNVYDYNAPTIFRHTGDNAMVSIAQTSPPEWDGSVKGGQLALTHSVGLIRLTDWDADSHGVGAWNSPTWWHIEATSWPLAGGGFYEFFAPSTEESLLATGWTEWNGCFTSYNPVSNSMLAPMQSQWYTDPDYHRLGYYVIIGAGEPPPPPEPAPRTFASVYTSVATARLMMRKSLPTHAAPVESDLTQTPGKVGVEIPPPVPATGMSIYPGEPTTDLIAPPNLVVKSGSFGEDLDPGVVQTWRGFPKSPTFRVMADTLCSTTGEFLSGNRDYPDQVDLGTDLRFFASDFTDEKRLPSTLGSDFAWDFQGYDAVSKVEASYRIGKEIFVFDAVSIEQGGWLDSDWPVSDLTSMTVSMVVIFRPPMGYTVLSGGGDPEWAIDANIYLKALFGIANTTSRIGISAGSTTPFYVTVTITPPIITCYYSTGPGHTQSFSVRTADTSVINTMMSIGKRSGVDPLATMEILEMSIDTHARTRAEVEDLIATYGSVYG